MIGDARLSLLSSKSAYTSRTVSLCAGWTFRWRKVDHAPDLAGLEKITSGTISIGGRVVNGLEPKDRGIAMAFQNYALGCHPDLV
jgi:hypothetical protein